MQYKIRDFIMIAEMQVQYIYKLKKTVSWINPFPLPIEHGSDPVLPGLLFC